MLVTRDDWHLAGADARPLAKSPRLLSPDGFARLGVLPIRSVEVPAASGAKLIAEKLTAAMKLRSPAHQPVLA